MALGLQNLQSAKYPSTEVITARTCFAPVAENHYASKSSALLLYIASVKALFFWCIVMI